MRNIRKSSLLRLINGILGLCVILLLFYIVSCSECTDRNTQEVFNKMNEGKLTSQEIVQIASNVIEERYSLKTSELKVYYDKENKIWNKYYAKHYPNLIEYDYQAIRFNRTGTLTIGGGPYWVCVDRETGEVLVSCKGM